MRYSSIGILHVMIFVFVVIADGNAESIHNLLARAVELKGTPYRIGGMDTRGFDCSGYVSYLYKPTLPDLPRISMQMTSSGIPVDRGHWRPGDLLFYATGDNPNRINHVAIWYSDGYIIHSVSGGPETGVVITHATSRYWSRHYITARRMLPQEDAGNIPSVLPSVVDLNDSFWQTFDGTLQGDYESWREADRAAFDAYRKRQN